MTDLRQGVTNLIETLESGGIPQLEPHERLDLWQYLQAVWVRLALVEQAMAGDAAAGQSGSSPSTTDISSRRRAKRARARRRSLATGIDESGGRRASR